MSIVTKDGRKVTRPAGYNDTPKIVAASFAVDDREKVIDMAEKLKNKSKTIILGKTQRDIVLSTQLSDGVSIRVEGEVAKKNLYRTEKDNDIEK